ncbi:MAG: hypothetical protein Q9222_007631 [Ikaeria aurantiellina]
MEPASSSKPSRPLTDTGVKVVIVSAVFMPLTTIAVLLRFYARRLKKVQLGHDDRLVLASLFVFYGYAINTILAVCIGGIGYHVDDLSTGQFQRGLKILLAGQVLYATGMGLIKCGICLMLIRIFILPSFRLAAYLVMSFSAAWALMTFLLAFLLCGPPQNNWKVTPTAGSCPDRQPAYAAVGIIGILTDLAILILPLFEVWKLQMPRKTKIACSLLFCLGGFTIAMSIVRVITVFGTDYEDFTFDTVNWVWPILEYGVAIIVSCGPLIRPLLKRKGALLPYQKSAKEAAGQAIRNKRSTPSVSMPLQGYENSLERLKAPGTIHTATTDHPTDDDESTLLDEVLKVKGDSSPSQKIQRPDQIYHVASCRT